MPLRPCLGCGEPVVGSHCIDCRPKDTKSREARGYGSQWARFSRRMRRLSPFCELCSATDDLTVDHSRQAWERHAAGLAIRPEDVRVLCRSCNSRAGRARP